LPCIISGATFIRSRPAVKCSPCAKITPQRIASSASSLPKASLSARSMSASNAFILAARLSPMSKSGPRASVVIFGASVMLTL